MKNEINKRLVGIAILAIIATVVGITIINYGLFQKQVRGDLAICAKLLKETHFFESVNRDTGEAEIELSMDTEKFRVTWVDSDGTVLYDNDAAAANLSNHSDRPEISEAFAEGVGESVRRSDTMNMNTYYYAVLLDNGTVLRVATQAQSLWAVFKSVFPIIALIILVIIAICVALSHLLTKQLLKPIEMMASNLDSADYSAPYRELEPFSETLRTQHMDILSAAKARQDFTANVSHELKTPLTAISGYAELLEEGMVSGDMQNHFYREIRKNSYRLLALINDIINLSELDRKEEGKLNFSEVDLNEILRECESELAENARQRDVEITFEGKPVMVRGNRNMLKELVENLAQNAITYNNPGGRVTVSVSEDGGRGKLIVKDNGIGIPLAEQQRVFERFYRVDKSRSKATGGTGLGLAIVKHIVELHGARIELDSAPGVGTTVAVFF